jgi:hypothetical protein
MVNDYWRLKIAKWLFEPQMTQIRAKDWLLVLRSSFLVAWRAAAVKRPVWVWLSGGSEGKG